MHFQVFSFESFSQCIYKRLAKSNRAVFCFQDRLSQPFLQMKPTTDTSMFLRFLYHWTVSPLLYVLDKLRKVNKLWLKFFHISKFSAKREKIIIIPKVTKTTNDIDQVCRTRRFWMKTLTEPRDNFRSKLFQKHILDLKCSLRLH